MRAYDRFNEESNRSRDRVESSKFQYYKEDGYWKNREKQLKLVAVSSTLIRPLIHVNYMLCKLMIAGHVKRYTNPCLTIFL